MMFPGKYEATSNEAAAKEKMHGRNQNSPFMRGAAYNKLDHWVDDDHQ